jgi:hypothetical protein
VAANFGNERSNLFEEEPISVDPNADSDTSYVPIDSATPMRNKMPQMEVVNPPTVF